MQRLPLRSIQEETNDIPSEIFIILEYTPVRAILFYIIYINGYGRSEGRPREGVALSRRSVALLPCHMQRFYVRRLF